MVVDFSNEVPSILLTLLGRKQEIHGSSDPSIPRSFYSVRHSLPWSTPDLPSLSWLVHSNAVWQLTRTLIWNGFKNMEIKLGVRTWVFRCAVGEFRVITNKVRRGG